MLLKLGEEKVPARVRGNVRLCRASALWMVLAGGGNLRHPERGGVGREAEAADEVGKPELGWG